MNLCFIDIETTGLEPPDAVILSIGAIADGEELYIVIKPTEEEWQRASPKALEVNGMTWEEVSQGVPSADAVWQLREFLTKHQITKDKGQFVGQNPTFDMKFLRHYMGDLLADAGVRLDNPVDVREVYRFAIKHNLVPVLDCYSGKNIANALGVPEEPEPHNALEGARVVGRNYLALKRLWKNRPQKQ
jgi:DNA polymerase III epsilon subunit-like protein